MFLKPFWLRCIKYYGIAYSYLQYSVICWGTTTKPFLRKLQIKQNYIVRIISYIMKFLNVEGIFRLEIAKLMMKPNSNKLLNILTKNLLK